MRTTRPGSGLAVVSRSRTLVAALTALGLCACGGGGGGDGSTGAPSDPTAPAAFVLTRDSPVGSFSVVPFDDPGAVRKNIGSVHSDSVARLWNGRIYVINRLGGDNIQAIDPSADYRTLWQCSVGNGSNPQDIAFVSTDKAYVSLYGGTDVLIVNPSTGSDCDGFIRGRISLAEFADDDGLPEMAQMVVFGERLYVSLQLLDQNDRFSVTDRSLLAVIDVVSDEVVDLDPSTPEPDGITLAGKNPFSDLIVDEEAGKILVAEVGSFSDIGDGGLDVVDLASNRAEGFAITEAELGGNLSAVALADDRRGYAIILDENFTNLVVRFDLVDRALVATLFVSEDFLPDIAYSAARDELYLADRSDSLPGLRVFGGQDDLPIGEGPIDTGLPPNSILLLESELDG